MKKIVISTLLAATLLLANSNINNSSSNSTSKIVENYEKLASQGEIEAMFNLGLIYATGDGLVIHADNSKSGFGNHIEINHGFGYLTLYAHLSKYNCKTGQRVKRGDIIGYVGSTGRSEGPHLHYEVHKDGKVVNPLNFYYGNISAEEYSVISKLANRENQSLD